MDEAKNETQPLRVAQIEREQVPPELGAVYDALLAQRGVVPNMFKALANVPPVALGFAAFLKPLLSDGNLSGVYKELVATRVGWRNRCDYCVAAHSLSARQKGASEPHIVGSTSEFASAAFAAASFSAAETLGFLLAERMCESGLAVDDEFFGQIKLAYTDAQIIELFAVAAAFAMFPRLVDGLRIPITPVQAGR